MKMDLAHVVQADNAGQVSGAFDNNPIVKAELLGFIAHTVIHVILLVCMELRVL